MSKYDRGLFEDFSIAYQLTQFMHQPAKYTAILGTFFFILFTAYASFSNIITQIHEQDGIAALGPFLLAVNYTSFMICNVFAPGFTWKYKKLMGLAALAYALNFSTGLLLPFVPVFLKYLITFVGASVAGLGAATLWTCMGGYIHLVCQKYNVTDQKGKYFGIFSLIYLSHSVCGALITTFGLGYFSQQIYFAIIGTIGVLASLFCFLCVKDIQQPSDMAKVQKFSVRRAAHNLYNFYPKMRHMLPLIFLDGVIIGFTSTSMTHLIPKSESKQQANIKAGIAFVFYGVGSGISGYLSGILNDKLSLPVSTYLNVLTYTMLIACSMFGLYLNSFEYTCFLFFYWGFTLYFIETHLLVVCSRYYGGRLESFAISKQLHSLSVVIYEVISISTENKISLDYIIPAMLLFIVPVLISSHYLVRKHKVNKFNVENLVNENQKQDSLVTIEQLVVE